MSAAVSPMSSPAAGPAVWVPAGLAAAAGTAVWAALFNRDGAGWGSVLHPVACLGHAAAAAAVASLVREYQASRNGVRPVDEARRELEARGAVYVGLGLCAFVLGLVAVFFTWQGRKGPYSEIQPALAPAFAGTAEFLIAGVGWLIVRRRWLGLPLPEPEPKVFAEPMADTPVEESLVMPLGPEAERVQAPEEEPAGPAETMVATAEPATPPQPTGRVPPPDLE
jgi:hypothetical protein